MEFEAVLLDAQRERANQLWIHARIKACVAQGDCEPVRQGERESFHFFLCVSDFRGMAPATTYFSLSRHFEKEECSVVQPCS